MAEDVSAFGQHRKFPPYARKASGNQGTSIQTETRNLKQGFLEQANLLSLFYPMKGIKHGRKMKCTAIQIQLNLYTQNSTNAEGCNIITLVYQQDKEKRAVTVKFTVRTWIRNF